MKLKFFELRDKATFIPVFAFPTRSFGNELGCDPQDQERWLLRRSGFGPDSHCIVLGRLDCSGCDRNCSYDPYAWGGRTYPVAHQYIEKHWNELQSGMVIDVEYILNEKETPKLSESFDPLGMGGVRGNPEQTEQVARTAMNKSSHYDSTFPQHLYPKRIQL